MGPGKQREDIVFGKHSKNRRNQLLMNGDVWIQFDILIILRTGATF
jgi:hypothetical protein